LALLVEMVHSNFDGPAQSVNGEQVFQPIIHAAEQNTGIWVHQRVEVRVRADGFEHQGVLYASL
jgi:hypothetical protein